MKQSTRYGLSCLVLLTVMCLIYLGFKEIMKTDIKDPADLNNISECDYNLPYGYSLLCHDNSSTYVVQTPDSFYLSTEWPEKIIWSRGDIDLNNLEDRFKGRRYLSIIGANQFNYLSIWITARPFAYAKEFKDSCNAKAWVYTILSEREHIRVQDSTRAAEHKAKIVADSLHKINYSIDHFKKCD